MDLFSSVSDIKGVGEKTAKLFNNLGVYTIGDILLFFPRTYLIYPEPQTPDFDSVNSTIAIAARVRATPRLLKTRTVDLCIAEVLCEESAVELVWFRSPYIRSMLEPGRMYIFYGRLQKDGNKLKMTQPAIFEPDKYEQMRKCIAPVYHTTKGLSNNAITKAVRFALDNVALEDKRLPDDILSNRQLMPYDKAISTYHFPDSFEELVRARKRLAYEEMFFFILNSRLQESQAAALENTFAIKRLTQVDEMIDSLDFKLTAGQTHTLDQIRDDISGPFISQRLIQGDVGSGKTIVAFLAMAETALCGYQAAIMAPTEVLARQHYETFSALTAQLGLDIPVVLFTGSQRASEKKNMQSVVDSNDSCFIIGTHALISEGRSFNNLALVITDEQHRFGVRQREALAGKGINPHMLVMSATPIPRTLAMILYGNMHVSTIKELPANRLPIKTCVIKESMRKTAYKFVLDEIKKGHQAYIICPLVEASETTEALNVMEYKKLLQEYIPDDIAIDILHGKMKPAEKNEIMDNFAAGKTQILVSTTVVEVGVNVPNATVIMIENASRFGLAALHQLRGRVGRGSDQSYCILMNDSKDLNKSKRLEVMLKSNDGFYIAQEDLKLRGPGDLFGVRQSGEFAFRVADIYDDADELQMASEDVDSILKMDPELQNNKALRSTLALFIADQSYVL